MPSVADAPRYAATEAARFASDMFGVIGTATPLPSERDQNFLITDAHGVRHVLKIANGAEQRSVIEAENGVMRHLAATHLTPTAHADVFERDGHAIRLISYLGTLTMGAATHRSAALRESLGRSVGTIDRALADFDHPALHRRFRWDLAGGAELVADNLHLVNDEPLVASITIVLQRHRDHVAPVLDRLRMAVIHNDANDHNVLVDATSQTVTGIVDFGDMVFSHLVNDVAVAMAYACLDTPDPLAAAADVLRGYHSVHPLTEDEIAVVFHLMCLRLCLSVCIGAQQLHARPDNDYLRISQGPVARTLPTLAATHARLARYTMRDACGLEPVPGSGRISAWLHRHHAELAHLTGFDLQTHPVASLDLSVGSALVAGDPAGNRVEPFSRRIDDALSAAGARIGVGGYGEPRLLYSTDAFSSGASSSAASASGAAAAERRTVHLGIDLTMAAGSLLYAPLDGVVHGFECADAVGDYGPMIVLRHEVIDDDGRACAFHTLYGHLSRESLHGLELGQIVQRGQLFAAIGEAPTNGDWWPHTHVQIVVDMLDVACNVNGACRPSDRAVWQSLCPDPSAIVGITTPEPVAAGPDDGSDDRLTQRRAHRIGKNLSVAYGDQPLHIRRGWMQYLFDAEGRRYLDAYNNVAHVGHSHPRVARRVAEQLAVLNTNTRYLQDQLLDYADALVATLPAPLSVCYFTASGSEANELALRLSAAHTGRRDVLVMDAAYHGHTTSLIDISPYKHDGPGGRGAPDWVHTTPIPDVFRGEFRNEHAHPGIAYAQQVGSIIGDLVERGRPPSAYIAETCPSVAGQIMLPSGFLDAVYCAARAVGAVCIADEVQTGFGRIGSHFWAFEAHDVVPDIVVLGKPIANGYPMGAVITTPEIAASFDNGMEFFSTFGGSTAACVAAHETLRVVVDEQLQAHALNVGGRLLTGLRELASHHDIIGDVRGSGLFIGVELVTDRSTLEPAAQAAAWIVQRMRELGVLLGTDGPLHNVIKIRGPLPFAEHDADRLLATFEQATRECPFTTR